MTDARTSERNRERESEEREREERERRFASRPAICLE